jgi:hypothetical protein
MHSNPPRTSTVAFATPFALPLTLLHPLSLPFSAGYNPTARSSAAAAATCALGRSLSCRTLTPCPRPRNPQTPIQVLASLPPRCSVPTPRSQLRAQRQPGQLVSGCGHSSARVARGPERACAGAREEVSKQGWMDCAVAAATTVAAATDTPLAPQLHFFTSTPAPQTRSDAKRSRPIPRNQFGRASSAPLSPPAPPLVR